MVAITTLKSFNDMRTDVRSVNANSQAAARAEVEARKAARKEGHATYKGSVVPAPQMGPRPVVAKAALPVVAPEPKPVVLDLAALEHFTVELPTVALPDPTLSIGAAQADFFTRLGKANAALLRQRQAITAQQAAYAADQRDLLTKAEQAKFWGQEKAAQDLINGASKRQVAAQALTPHLNRVDVAIDAATRMMANHVAHLSDDMAAHLMTLRHAAAEAAQTKARTAAEAVAKKAQAAELAAAMMSHQDDEPEQMTLPVEEGEESELDVLKRTREEYSGLIGQVRKEARGRDLTDEEIEAIASYQDEFDRLSGQIKALLQPVTKVTKTQRRKANKASGR